MKQQGILSAGEFIKWKKGTGSLKVPVSPRHLILCPHQVLPSKFQSLWLKKIKGIMGRHICIDRNKGVYLSTGWGIGGAALVATCELFYELGVRNFIFIGLACRLAESITEGEVRYARLALREEGTSDHYLTDANSKFIECQSDYYFNSFLDLGFREGAFVSTDAPFRETSKKLKEWTDNECVMLDMETASFYAFAKYYNTNAVSLGIGADSIANNEWRRPSDLNRLNAISRKTVYQMLDLIQ